MGSEMCIRDRERIELLDAIGMQWEKPDSWQYRYELAQEYKRVHGNLDIPAKYKTADGIWLGRWIYNQKRLLQSVSEKLSENQKEQLEKLLNDSAIEFGEKVGSAKAE